MLLALTVFLLQASAASANGPEHVRPQQAAAAGRQARPGILERAAAALSRPAHPDLGRQQAAEDRQAARRHQARRTEGLRSSARFFEKITQRGDYRGEHVLYRDAHASAFLDMTDPAHPRYRTPEDVEEGLEQIPEAKRVHVLVVPNQPREHIARSLGGSISLADLREVTRVMETAERLARELKVQNPRIYANSESRIGVGYFHVHIVSERTAETRYPAPLAEQQ